MTNKFLFIFISISLVFMNGCEPKVKSEFSPSIFNRCKAKTSREITEAELVKDWFSMPVIHSEGMFNPVFLLFEYTCESVIEDPKQAITFPCLLSFKFDFVPDNFSARHPAFIYRKDPGVFKIEITDAEEIAYYIKEWSATHAIGGELIQTPKGYKGSLVVFDKDGKEILRENYNTPMPYFILMGNMVKAWMEFRQQPITEGLMHELMRPMTTDMETVRWYGDTFDVEWRSQDEWNIYEKILERDPDFAEIRFWYANQKGWEAGDNEASYAEYVKALQSHIVMPAIGYFSYMRVSDQSVRNQYEGVVLRAKDICGENPVIARVYMEINNNTFSPEELDRFLPLVEKYACYKPFVEELGDQYSYIGQYDKACPLYLSVLYSPYLPGIGSTDFHWAFKKLSGIFLKLGYLAESMACLDLALTDYQFRNKPWLYFYKGCVLQELFNFEEAKKFLITDNFTYDIVDDIFLEAAMGLFAIGDFDAIKTLEADPEMQVFLYGIESLFKARKALANNDPTLALSLIEKSPFRNRRLDELHRFETEVIKTETFLSLNQKGKALQHASRGWYMLPRSRRAAYLLEVVLDRDIRSLGRFMEVVAFIFPEQSYWTDKLAALRAKGYRPDSDEQILALYDSLKEQLTRTELKDKVEFWLKKMPFSVEYLCLRMIQMKNKQHRDNALNFYIDFATSISRLSRYQEYHSRIFLKQLLLFIPEEEQKKWMKKLESEIENSFGRYNRYVSLGWLYVEKENCDAAMAAFKKAIEIGPDNEHAYAGMGYVHWKKGMYNETIEMCKKALSINKNFREPYINIGNAYLGMNMHNEALDEFKKAMKVDPNHAKRIGKNYDKAYYNRGCKFAEKGMFDKAIEEYLVSVAINPSFSWSQYNLACAYARKNEKEKAIQNLKKAIELEEKLREEAKSDKSFNNIRNEKEFQKLISKK